MYKVINEIDFKMLEIINPIKPLFKICSIHNKFTNIYLYPKK